MFPAEPSPRTHFLRRSGGCLARGRTATFAAITSRSYDPGGVNVLFGDGSVKFVKSCVDGLVWRAVGTVAGGEVVGGDRI